MGQEVGKGSEFEVCPICGKTDWCFVVFGGDSPKINCKRIDEQAVTGVDGELWQRTDEHPKLGANYILSSVVDDYRRKLRKERQGRGRAGNVATAYKPRVRASKPKLDLNQRTVASSKTVELTARELQPLQWSVVNEDEWSVEREVVYPYPSVSLSTERTMELAVLRRQWDDRRPVYHRKRSESGALTGGKTKMVLPMHRLSGESTASWNWGKGQDSGKAIEWPLYRWDEVERFCPPVLCWAAGEKCVEALRSLGLVAVSAAFGENASDTATLSVLKQVGKALESGYSERVLLFVDEDEAGIKFAEKVLRFAAQVYPHRFHAIRIPQVVSGLGLSPNDGESDRSDSKGGETSLPTCENQCESITDIADLVEAVGERRRIPLRGYIAGVSAQLQDNEGQALSNQNFRGSSSGISSSEKFSSELLGHVSPVESTLNQSLPAFFPPNESEPQSHSWYPGNGTSSQNHIEIGNGWVDLSYLNSFSEQKLKPGLADSFSRAFSAAVVGVAYDLKGQEWYSASGAFWEPLPEGELERGIREAVIAIGSSVARQFMNDAIYFLRLSLGSSDWGASSSIFFLNGKLNLANRTFSPVEQSDLCRKSDALQFPYDPSGSTECPKIRAFLAAFEGEAIAAGIAASIYQMGYLQRFVHLIGVPGSGKGTCLRLVRVMLGNGAVTTSLMTLESRFEAAKFDGAKAVLIPEGIASIVDPEVLKRLTGSDLLRYEVKHSQSKGKDFIFSGIVFLATNGVPRWTESSAAAISRRARVVRLTDLPSERKILLEFARVDGVELPIGELAEELPQFANWILSMTQQQIEEELCKHGIEAEEVFVSSSPIAEWFNERCFANNERNHYHKMVARCPIGSLLKPGTLFHDFCEWADSANLKPISVTEFKEGLETLLKTRGIEYEMKRTSTARLQVFGIGLAGDDDMLYPLTGK